MNALYQRVCAPEVLREAWERVEDNRGCPGIDGVSLEDFEEALQENLDQLHLEIEEGRFLFQPLVRLPITEEDGRERPIDVPTVRDRVVHQALLEVLRPLFEPTFSDCSFAYRPDRSALMAIQRVEELIRSGNPFILRTDIQDFFGSIPHEPLLELIRARVDDPRVLDLIRRSLTAGTLDGMKVRQQSRGVPQGMALSPLFGNLYLNRFDRTLTGEGILLVRFADDLASPAPSEEIAQRALARMREVLGELKLDLNERKTLIRHVEKGFVFLGYYLDQNGRGPSKRALDAVQRKLSEAVKEDEGLDLSQKLGELETIIRGWSNYFGGCTGIRPADPWVLLALARFNLSHGKEEPARRLLAEGEGVFSKEAADSELRRELQRLQKQIGAEPTVTGLPAGAPPASEGPPPPLPVETFEAETSSSPEWPLPADPEGKLGVPGDPYASVSKLRRLLHFHPDYGPAYRELAECYAVIGQYGLAKKAFEKALELEPSAASDAEREAARLPANLLSADQDRPSDAGPVSPELSEAQLALFLRLFSGREGVHGRQWVDSEGRRGFSPVESSLDREALRRHLQGKETLGLYLVRRDDTVGLMALDVDVSNKLLLQYAKDTEKLKEFDSLTQKDLLRLVQVCEKMDLPAYLEESGYKGRHCWLFFETPILAKEARNLARLISQQAGLPSAGLRWEVFPNQDHVRPDRLGPLIKLPLGIHQKTGRRCFFIDTEGRPQPDQGRFLEEIRRIPKLSVDRLLGLQPANGVEVSPPEVPPQIEAVLEGCKVVRHLVEKARDTNYLTHLERVTLLYTVGHLEEEGKAFLHKVIEYCLNYKSDYTERQIQRMKESPISCHRIQTVHEEILQSVGCPCGLKAPPRRYPSPVLFAYRKGFRPLKAPEGKDGEEKEPRRESVPVASPGEGINPLLKRFIDLKKHLRGIENSLKECEARMSETFDRLGVDTLQTDLGLLVRKWEGGVVDWWIDV